MLAYELFLKNKEYAGEYRSKPTPIKKFFAKRTNKGIEVHIDERSLEEYGAANSDIDEWQRTFSMPLDTWPKTGLPYKETGSASFNPYVEFYGFYKTSKTKSTLTISLTGKVGKEKKKFENVLDLETRDVKKEGCEELSLRIKKNEYYIGNQTLFEAYVDAEIIDKNCSIRRDLFDSVCDEFFKFFMDRLKDAKLENVRKKSFRLVILPKDEPVTFKEEISPSEVKSEEFVDSFGRKSTTYPTKTTYNAKFMSYDDLAFTINCTKGPKFYANLGIGDASLEKINLPSESIKISGLDWYFFDIVDQNIKFTDKKKGFYHQLLSNYNELKKQGKSDVTKSLLKVICLKRTQKKYEILLDENLTLTDTDLKEMLRPTEKFNEPRFAFEVLIDTSGEQMLWSRYLECIRNFIKKTPLPKEYLLHYFSKRLRENIFDWLKPQKHEEATHFFERSGFCLMSLTEEGRGGIIMDKDEEYAYKIGKIAGQYVNFKKDVGEESGATSSLLTYSKYDREKLRFVYARIGLGINLSKADKEKKREILRFINENAPSGEIPDENALKDYSYFFYKGVFEQLKG